MASRLGVPAAVLVASLLAASAAVAEPSAGDRETARTMMEQGRTLTEKGDLEEALKRFKAADDIMHVPTTGLRVAKTQVTLGRLVEARDTIAAIRRTPEKPSDPRPFKDARAEADQLDASLASRVPALVITVTGAADGEQPTLTIDGVDVPSAVVGLTRSVDPGHHVVAVKTPTGEGRAEVDVREGEQKPVEVKLVPTAPAPTAPAEEPATQEETPPARSHAPTALTWAGIGVAGAGVAAGVVTGVLSISKKSTLSSACTGGICGPAQYGTLDSARTLATVSDVAFIAAGVGAVVAVVSLVAGHGASPEPAAQPPATTGLRVVPWIGPGSGGLRGTFY